MSRRKKWSETPLGVSLLSGSEPRLLRLGWTKRTIKRSLIEKETYEGESEDRKRVNKAKWKEVEKKKRGGGSAKTFPQTESYVEHMDGFNPVMVRLMSRPHACPQLAQTFLLSVRDNRHRFVLMMDDRAKRTPNRPPPNRINNLNVVIGISYSLRMWRVFLTDPMCLFHRLCSDQRDVQQVPQLHHQRGHGPGAGVHHRPRIRAQVSCFTQSGWFTKQKKENFFFPAVRFLETHTQWNCRKL